MCCINLKSNLLMIWFVNTGTNWVNENVWVIEQNGVFSQSWHGSEGKAKGTNVTLCIWQTYLSSSIVAD